MDNRENMQKLLIKLKGKSMSSNKIKRTVKKKESTTKVRTSQGKRGCSKCNRRKQNKNG